jgi:hypothetical protein
MNVLDKKAVSINFIQLCSFDYLYNIFEYFKVFMININFFLFQLIHKCIRSKKYLLLILLYRISELFYPVTTL